MGMMQDGGKTGLWSETSSSGTKAVGNYVGNKRSGEWSFYNPAGQLIQKGSYVDGKEDGVWTGYTEKGTIAGKATFKNGVQQP